MYIMEFYIAALVIFCVGEVTSCYQTGHGEVHRLKVVGDIWLEKSYNTKFHPEFLIVGKLTQFQKKRSLLIFEDIPDDCETINFAMMYIYYSYSHKASWQSVTQSPFISRTIQAHRVLKYWNETQATYAIRNGSDMWHTPYLGLDDTDANDCPTGHTTIHTLRPAGFVEIEVTSAVQDWKAGKPNYGLLIWATNEDTDGRDTRFHSKEYSDSTKHPYMVVNCN